MYAPRLVGLIYLAITAAIYGGAWRRRGYRPDLFELLPAAMLAVFPAVLVWWLVAR